jgi:hypothetical protein
MTLDYLAGLVDGEGTISLNRNASIYLRISSSKVELLEAVQQHFGGQITLAREADDVWAAGYHIGWYGQEAENLIRQLRHRLVLKYPQADVALLTREMAPGRGGKWNTKAREFLVAEMRTLNARGSKAA